MKQWLIFPTVHHCSPLFTIVANMSKFLLSPQKKWCLPKNIEEMQYLELLKTYIFFSKNCFFSSGITGRYENHLALYVTVTRDRFVPRVQAEGSQAAGWWVYWGLLRWWTPHFSRNGKSKFQGVDHWNHIDLDSLSGLEDFQRDRLAPFW